MTRLWLRRDHRERAAGRVLYRQRRDVTSHGSAHCRKKLRGAVAVQRVSGRAGERETRRLLELRVTRMPLHRLPHVLQQPRPAHEHLRVRVPIRHLRELSTRRGAGGRVAGTLAHRRVKRVHRLLHLCALLPRAELAHWWPLLPTARHGDPPERPEVVGGDARSRSEKENRRAERLPGCREVPGDGAVAARRRVGVEPSERGAGEASLR
mmetsp:Transcript_233/g.471  ORF Transcript_233/g.471 Transcript_233/m.471 type:complete len:209 (-) Transcript_233:96-722(-)